ncbi:Protein of unknown function (DUF3754) [Fragilaria crotonensis]|nr:Protein of unknown function (DUF3754) [Fragilaria crotonensis]
MRFIRWLSPYALCASFVIIGRKIVAFHLPVPRHRFTTVTFLTTRVDGSKRTNDDKESFENSVCRIVASSDGKLPSSKSALQGPGGAPPFIGDKLDMIYHALSHKETRNLEYLETEGASNMEEEEKLLLVLRKSLEDAGFQRLTQRDLDLCDALNAGYLLRLSIQPDVSDLDPLTAVEMYPELVAKNGTSSEFLFDGRVLVYRRGYSSETTKGRLLLPKLDYLQASLVQESAFKVTLQLGKVERAITQLAARVTRRIRLRVKMWLESAANMLRPRSLGEYARRALGWRQPTFIELKEEIRRDETKENVLFKLRRYGGSKIRFVGAPNIINALSPFLICMTPGNEETDNTFPNGGKVEENATHEIYTSLNKGDYTCQYDAEHPDRYHKGPMPTTLLKRISIGNVVDVFSAVGRRRMLRNFLSIVELVEPTYEEVVVVWRPMQKKRKPEMKERIPAVVYEMAEIFDMEHKLPDKFSRMRKPKRPALQIRAFTGVPMANLPAVFPKTRLIFRPADAFLFDLISVLTLILVLGSQRFDNPKLDLVAIISVSLWLFRTVLRYSNKLARYDLLVKNFLTSKIAHRNSGAVKYVSNEAASQRATRAALLYSWLARRPNHTITLDQLKEEAFVGVNELLGSDQYVDVNVLAGLKDLEALNLVSLSDDESEVIQVAPQRSTVDILQFTWTDIFDGQSKGVTRLRNQTVEQLTNVTD